MYDSISEYNHWYFKLPGSYKQKDALNDSEYGVKKNYELIGSND